MKSMDGSVRVLSAGDVSSVLGIGECVDAVEDAFRKLGRGQASRPGVLGVHVAGGGFHIKAATLEAGRSYFAAKTNGNFPGNPARGLRTIQGVIVLSDAANGTPLAVMDSVRITELRTGAATAVAARHLARPGPAKVTLIGCGAQAASQLAALACVRPLSEVWVADLDTARAERFAERMTGELGVRVAVTRDPAARTRESDISVTCTPARRPVLHAGDVAPGAFIAAVGADSPEKHEIDPRLFGDVKVVVDSLEQCVEIGDLHHAIAAGVMRPADVHAELAEIVTGGKAARSDDTETFVFDSTGTALQDVALAARVFERALDADLGLAVALAGE